MNDLWQQQLIGVHKLRQLAHAVHVVHFVLELCADNRLEQVPDNADELGRVHQVQGFQILLISETACYNNIGEEAKIKLAKIRDLTITKVEKNSRINKMY